MSLEKILIIKPRELQGIIKGILYFLAKPFIHAYLKKPTGQNIKGKRGYY